MSEVKKAFLSPLAIVAIVLGGFFSLLVAGAIWGVMQFIAAKDYAGKTEPALVAARDAARTKLGNIETTVVEIMQIDAANRDQAIELVRAAVTGRYGPNGSQAMFQSLQEAGIPLDNKIKEQAARALEAGRRDYQVRQDLMMQRAADYQGQINTTIRGFFINMAGYPKINFADFKGVATKRADQAFERGYEEGAIKIYQSK